MAKISGINTNIRGQVGAYLFRKTKYGTIVSEAPERRKVPVRTEEQMYIRTQWVNLAAIYRQFKKTLKKAYEGLGNTMSVYNAFVQANINVVKVFITKKIRDNGGSVLAPYQITRGSLPSINYEKNGSNVLVTDIALGSLVIAADTEVGELAEAVIGNNLDYQAGDQISFFYGRQTVDSVTATPRARIDGTKVVLDVTNTTPLWDVVGSLGFATVDGHLGMSRTITDGAAAWVHSREPENGVGDVLVGTQSLFVDSSVLATYQSDSAFSAATDSYGGINAEKVFLDPSTSRSRRITAQTETVVPLNGDEQSGSNSGTSGTGGQQGGGSSEAPTVAAPTISGSTPFEESTSVTMSAESGATIYYTTDGSNPTSSSTQYSSALTLTDTTTVKAIAVKDGTSSSVASRTFTKGDGEDVS